MTAVDSSPREEAVRAVASVVDRSNSVSLLGNTGTTPSTSSIMVVRVCGEGDTIATIPSLRIQASKQASRKERKIVICDVGYI